MKRHICRSLLLLFLFGVLGCGGSRDPDQQAGTTDGDAASVAKNGEAKQIDGKRLKAVAESAAATVADAKPSELVYLIEDFAGALILRPRQMTETSIGKQIPVDEFLEEMSGGGAPFRAADLERVTMLGMVPEAPGSEPSGIVVMDFVDAATLAKVRQDENAPFARMIEAEHAGRTYLRFPEFEFDAEPPVDEVLETEAFPTEEFEASPEEGSVPPDKGDDCPRLDGATECQPNDGDVSDAADDPTDASNAAGDRPDTIDDESPIEGHGDLGPDQFDESEFEAHHSSGPAFYFSDDRTMVFGEETALKQVLEARKPSGPLPALLASVNGDHDIIAIGVTGPVNELLNNVDPAELPPQLGPILGLSTQVKSAILVVDLDGPQLAQLTLNTPDGDSAGQVHAMLDGLLQFGKNLFQQNRAEIVKDMQDEVPEGAVKLMDEFVAAASTGVDKQSAQVTLTIDAPPSWNELPVIVEAMMAKQRERAAAFRRQINAQSIAFGFFNHESVYEEYPRAAAAEEAGGSAVSWRVRILPYLDEQELYDEYKLDEPWNSEQNMKLLAKMPEIFGNDPGGKTRYMVFIGDDTLFGQQGKLTLGQVKDGLSNSILFVEAGADVAVPWTQPADLKFDPKNPIAALGSLPDEGFTIVMMDGSVMTLPKDVAAEKLKAAITHAGGEEVELFDANGDFPDSEFPGNTDTSEPEEAPDP